MSRNPLRALPPGVPWQPIPFPLREGLRLAARLLGPLLRPDQLDPVAGYLFARTGAALFWKPTSEQEFVQHACQVYLGLFDAGMNVAPEKLMALHVLVSSELEGSQETLFAAQTRAEEKSLDEVEKGQALLSYYARLVEAWKLLAAVPAMAKELYVGTAGKHLTAEEYLAADSSRIRILSLAASIPNIAPYPINLLVRGVDRHIRNANYHQAGIQIRGRRPTRFLLKDRKWSREMTVDEIEQCVQMLNTTVQALQTGLLIARINHGVAYSAEVGKITGHDERYEAYMIEMAAADSGFEPVAMEMTPKEVSLHLRLMRGAFSQKERDVTQYLKRSDGSVTKKVFQEPAFVWNTTEQLINLLSYVVMPIRGRDLRIRVEGADGEPMGSLAVSAESTSKLGPDFGINDLLSEAKGAVEDTSPVDLERSEAISGERPDV